jgi:hypothetical protein
MIKNLLNTWEILAPDEVRCDEHGLVWLKDRYSASMHIEPMSDGSLLPFERFILQGYLQQCIEARGWQLFLVNTKSYSSIEIQVESIRYKSGDLKASKKLIQTLLTAYLTALAAQRPITAGQWRHFKGDVVDVRAVASWTTHPLFDFCVSDHSKEESPEEKITLHLAIDDIKSQTWGYHAFKDYGDRVFYRHDDKNWARKIENFLGLVDAKNPDHEGLLRFVEVPQ